MQLNIVCFIRQFLVEKAANSNILLQSKIVFVSKASKSFYFNQQKLSFGIIVFSQKRDMDRSFKELNSILRRHYGFIMTVLRENIFSLNSEYTFSQLAVIIKQ